MKRLRLMLGMIFVCVLGLFSIIVLAETEENTTVERVMKMISSEDQDEFLQLINGADSVEILIDNNDVSTYAVNSNSEYIDVLVSKEIDNEIIENGEQVKTVEETVVVLRSTAYPSYWGYQTGVYDIAMTFRTYVTQYIEYALPVSIRMDYSQIQINDAGSDSRYATKVIGETRFENSQGMNVAYRASQVINYPSSGVLYQQAFNSTTYNYPDAIIIIMEIYLSDGTMHQMVRNTAEIH